MTPLVAELTLPALFAAGATTSLHCALMCGAINVAQVRSGGALPLRQTLALVHAGRVLGYALLGALAGALGARLALWLPDTVPGGALQALASLALVAAGIQHCRGGNGEKGVRSIFSTHAHSCRPGPQKMDLTPFPPRARLLAQGLAWALMPCGILYTVLALAALTASAPAGLLLLAAFGLGTVPLMGASGGLLARLARRGHGRGLRRATGAALIVLGGAGVLAALLHGAALPAWCGAA